MVYLGSRLPTCVDIPPQTVIYLSALAIFVFLPLTGLLLVLAVYLLTGITKSVIGTIRNVMVDASREK